MEPGKHFFDLLQEAFEIGFITWPVKENGITLYFAYLQIQMIAVYYYFKQFLDYVLTMQYFRFRHKLSKPAYIGHKQ
jgi:hypothetical protein